jgi:hexosaminidase
MTFPRLAAVAEAGWTPAISKECSLFMQRLPFFLEYLDSKDIYYFNPFAPDSRPEPGEPEKKEDILQNG